MTLEISASCKGGECVQMIAALHRPDAEHLLLALGYRFLLLALAREDGYRNLETVTVEGMLEARICATQSFQPRSMRHQMPDARARLWYGEVIACFSSTVPSYTALSLRAMAFARLGHYQASLDDLVQAQDLATTPEQSAQIFLWRGVVLLELQDTKGAVDAFSQACELHPSTTYADVQQSVLARLA